MENTYPMKTFTRMSWLLAVLTLVSGCVMSHPTDPYAGMAAYDVGRPPDGASHLSTRKSVDGPMTLNECIDIAMENNPDPRAATYEIHAAKAQRDLAAGRRLPSLNLISGYNHYLDSQRLIPAQENFEIGVFSRDIFAGDLIVSLPLFTGGQLTSEIRAAELLQRSAEHGLARTKEELVFNVSSVFYGILAQRHVIESLEFSRQALQEHDRRIQDLIAARKAAKVDRLRTQVRIADLDQRLAREQNLLAIQSRVLTNLLGLDRSEQPVEPVGELVFTQAATPEIDRSTHDALAGRPDYLAARAALEAQAKTVDAAHAAHWPTILLQGAYGGRWAADPTDRPSGGNSSDDVGRVGIALDLPIFEGGRIEARVRQERARLSAEQERLRRLELQVRLDVETAILNIGSAAQRVEATGKAIDQAEESLRIEREKYDLGRGSITDVLDAQSALLDSQTNYYRALADYSTASAQLKLAMGGP
jgi:outer membrane protein TolC